MRRKRGWNKKEKGIEREGEKLEWVRMRKSWPESRLQ